MKKHHQSFLYLIIFSWFLFMFNRCANVQPPQGGAKDTIPPVLLGSIPHNGELNFKGNTVTLFFDEDIILENLAKELVIAPNEGNSFKHVLKRNKLTLRFDKPFRDSTTYTLDFRTTVKDFSEKNPAKNLRLAFSTWNVLDTLFIKGEVRDLFTGKPVKDAVVALYNDQDTLTITKNVPLYLAKTNENGEYLLSNLSAKNYKIYALVDKDNNLKYNKDEEAIGFLSSPIFPAQQDSLVLFVTTYDNKNLVFNKAQTQKEYTELIFNKPLYQATIMPVTGKNIDEIYYKKEKNSIRLYYKGENVPQDSVQIAYVVMDSLENSLSQTINVKFASRESEKKEKPKKEETVGRNFSATPIAPQGNEFVKKQKFDIILSFPLPIDTFYVNTLRWVRGKDTSFVLQKNYLNEERTHFIIESITSEEDVSLEAKKGAFISIFGDSSGVISLKYTVKKPDKYGIINGKVDTERQNYVVQLLNDRYEVEQEIKNATAFRFEYVQPGKKFLRVLLDENGDGKWSKGSFQKNIPPETIFHFLQEIEVKANWEIAEESILLKF